MKKCFACGGEGIVYVPDKEEDWWQVKESLHLFSGITPLQKELLGELAHDVLSAIELKKERKERLDRRDNKINKKWSMIGNI